MLKRIPLFEYKDDDEATYRICVECYMDDYRKLYNNSYNKDQVTGIHRTTPDICVRNRIDYDLDRVFDEFGMERLVMLIAGILFCLENGGIPEDDPADLAYTAWYDLQDFCTGNYDDLFKPGDIADIKQDVKTILDYYDAHPALKGD